jgi:GNAT superfamily N-acetyltransferase
VPVRRATLRDVAGIAALVQQYWDFESIEGFATPRIAALLSGLLSQPDRGACWVAEMDGRLCGYLLAVFMFSLEHGGLMAEIDEVFVTEDVRSAGLGSLLVAEVDRQLAQQGLTRLQLQLGVGNGRARLFYERHGFRRRSDYELFDKPLNRPVDRPDQ